MQKRSCLRGIGPPQKMRRMPDRATPTSTTGRRPTVSPRGPLAPRRALIAGSWWLTREVELATARAALIRFPLRLEATCSLPSWSKADPAALGTMRTVGCCCKKRSHWQRHACRTRCGSSWADLRSWFPERHSSEGSLAGISRSFPTSSRSEAVHRAGHHSPGYRLCGRGPSLRVGGAQSLAVAGLDTWTIQLVGRWGSEAVLGFARDASLGHVAHVGHTCLHGAHAGSAESVVGLAEERVAGRTGQVKGRSGTSTTTDAPLGEEGTFWLNPESEWHTAPMHPG